MVRNSKYIGTVLVCGLVCNLLIYAYNYFNCCRGLTDNCNSDFINKCLQMHD